MYSLFLEGYQVLCTGEFSGDINFYHLTDSKVLFQPLRHHTDRVNSFETLHINNVEYLASASADKTVIIWDLSTRKCFLELPHVSVVNTLASVDIDEKEYLICGCEDGSIILWYISCVEGLATHSYFYLTDEKEAKKKISFNDKINGVDEEGPGFGIYTFAIIKPTLNVYLATAINKRKPDLPSSEFVKDESLNYLIMIWDLETKKESFRLSDRSGYLTALKEITNDGKEYLASSHKGGTIIIWNLSTRKSLYKLEDSKGDFINLTTLVINKKQYIASLHNRTAFIANHCILIWDVSTQECEFVLDTEHSSKDNGSLNAMTTIIMNGVEYLVSGVSDEMVYVWV